MSRSATSRRSRRCLGSTSGSARGRPATLRDRVQLRLLEAFRSRLHPSLSWRTEVPLPIGGDRRAWDAVIGAPDGLVGIEGLSRIGAADATIRRVNLKLADDPRISRAVLVVNDTARNRSALRAASDRARRLPAADARGHGRTLSRPSAAAERRRRSSAAASASVVHRLSTAGEMSWMRGRGEAEVRG